MSRLLFSIAACMTLLVFPVSLAAQERAIIDYKARFQPIIGDKGMVVSQEMRASQAGLQVLKDGGNAVDAAVAVGMALAVTLPKAGNIGGGGFMLVHLAEEKKTVAINFREMAPAKAHRDMYLDENGEVDNQKARFSYHSVGVPGTVKGLAYARDKYGSKPWKDLLAPAINLADNGMLVTHGLFVDLGFAQRRMRNSPAAMKIFYREDGTPPPAGTRLYQKDLAWSLKQIADGGPDAFYKGAVGKRLAADMAANGGLITLADLAAYTVTESEPVRGTYRGYTVASMPPPSSGGVHLIQMLNILEGYELKDLGHNSAAYLHFLTEVMKPAYADRSKYLGDPAFWDVPVEGLTDKKYAEELRKAIDPKRARPSNEVAPGKPPVHESPMTTHYSVMDRWGNAVSVTYTLNFSFGAHIVADGTGILLNNEMDDFSAKPGSPNGYGLLGGEANAIEPKKRPLSSMTPTIVFKDNKPWLVTGTPGGSTIITGVLQNILNAIEFDMNAAEAASVPRIHHQWLPDMIRVEQGISEDTIKLLEAMGHKIRRGNAMGSIQSIRYENGLMFGGSDPRRADAGVAAWWE